MWRSLLAPLKSGGHSLMIRRCVSGSRGWVLLTEISSRCCGNATHGLFPEHDPERGQASARIVEAIPEGVSFTSLEYAGSADSIGVIRPRLSKRDKAQAVLRAFHYSGRPYDFNFDFQTDTSLTCSELIFKVYEPGGGMKGLRFPVVEVMERKVGTPNGMVKQFDEQAGTATVQTDFVLFTDGIEKEKRAVESTAEQFRASWKRLNRHILVQGAPAEAKGK